ncbi:hypothetical protein [Chryseobacterium sp.]|uniref:hypothetical protein n=1 Tax=Chryseobacterium sp. TaxID=1871047 RepID=UPI0028A022A6|nr:hypothetical protein [Chryseobacterium sp.]
MNAKHEHKRIVDFVQGFKEANKNTVEKVFKYDPKLKSWTYQLVQRDENALGFHQKIKRKARNEKEKERRLKQNVAKSAPLKVNKTFVVRKKISDMRLNVVQHRADGWSFNKIADKYKVSETSCRTAYHRETHKK